MTGSSPISFDDGQARPGAVTCSGCGRTLQQYWTVAGTVLCESCKDARIAERASPEGRYARFGKATLWGTGGMLVGAGAWAAIEYFADYQLALIAILLGYLVGKGVFRGSGGRGGLRYQLLALGLTWFGFGLSSFPTAMREFTSHPRAGADSSAQVASATAGDSASRGDTLGTPAAVAPAAGGDSAIAGESTLVPPPKPMTGRAFLVGLAAILGLIVALPVLLVTGSGSFILVIIYGVGLYEAWKFTRAVPLAVSGPHPVAPATG